MSLYRINRKEQRNKPLTNKCIILDLDETLIHSSEDHSEFSKLNIFSDIKFLDVRKRMYSFSFDGYNRQASIWGVSRPGLDDFIPFCFDYFAKVCVWSAGQNDYVTRIVNNIFPTGYEPHVVYARDNCHYSHDREIFKPIEKMIQQEKLENVMTLENTLFLDDRELAFIKNPGNGIIIPPYDPNPTLDGINFPDTRLDELREWLMKPEVMKSKDVRTLDKKSIFKGFNPDV